LTVGESKEQVGGQSVEACKTGTWKKEKQTVDAEKNNHKGNTQVLGEKNPKREEKITVREESRGREGIRKKKPP